MEEKILVITKETGEKPTSEYIPNNLCTFSQKVKGRIKIIPYSNNRYPVENVFCIVNEEGTNLPLNFIIGNEIVYGNVIFVSKDIEGNITGLMEGQISSILKIYGKK